MRNLILTAAVIILSISTSTFAADKAKSKGEKMPVFSAEQRKNMADLHEKMAQCLRSDKAIEECHADMKTGCESLGKDGCPMMGKTHGHHGMKHEHHEHDMDGASEK